MRWIFENADGERVFRSIFSKMFIVVVALLPIYAFGSNVLGHVGGRRTSELSSE